MAALATIGRAAAASRPISAVAPLRLQPAAVRTSGGIYAPVTVERRGLGSVTKSAQGLLRAKPQFEAAGFRLAVVSIGSPEGGREFCAAAPFPPEQLLLDGDHALHRHVGCVEGFKSMSSPKTWEAMRAREWDEFKSLLGRYKMIAPKTVEATAVMGGVWVLDGDQCLYEFKDSGPGVHAPLADVLAAVKAA